jgi:class 3 adenylate cyclase
MLSRLKEMGTRLKQTNNAEFGVFTGTLGLHHRMGIRTGRAVAGNIGGQTYRKYGNMEAVVNISACFGQIDKQYEISLLISSGVYEKPPPDLQDLVKDRGEIELKGRKKQPQRIYSL